MLLCPNCGSEAGFLIETNAVMCFDSHERCRGNYTEPDYNGYSICTCLDCDYESVVKEFKVYGVVNTGGSDATNHKQD